MTWHLPAETAHGSGITQIYEGTNQIQRLVMARQLLQRRSWKTLSSSSSSRRSAPDMAMANLSIAPTAISPRAAVAISGFVDHHTHLLKEAAGTPFPWQGPPSAPFMSRYGATARPPWTCRSPRPVSHSKKERKACTAAWAAPPRNFDDEDSAGILFQDSSTLARRIEPFAATGWRIATHAIGDRAVEAVLDAYDMAWGADRHAISAAMPRIEHGSVLTRGASQPDRGHGV